jgi:hypothetical protein
MAIVKPSAPKIHPQITLQPKPKIIKAPRK